MNVQRGVSVTALDLAMRYLGIEERPGPSAHPLISFWLELCSMGRDCQDETPWCSAFVNGIAWELRLPRSKMANARSWLNVGLPVANPIPGWDVVVLWRGNPGSWKGHVGFYMGEEGNEVIILGGNQSNRVSIDHYSKEQLLGYRRLRW